MKTLVEQILSRTVRNPFTGCRVWTGAITSTGHGCIWGGSGSVSVHRVVYAQAHGKIPEGAHVLQSCGDKACCELEHLVLVRRQSIKERLRRSAHAVDPFDADSCIEWIKARDLDGYGLFTLANPKRQVRAHRYVYEEAHGPIPDELMVLHSCHNPPCINIRHLRAGTAQDNSDDMIAAGRQKLGINLVLTEDDVRAIRASTETQKSLAKRYGVSVNTIGETRRGVRWKNVV